MKKLKELKLEVGKTYRSREGEDVEIKRKDNTDDYPFQGSDGEWYTESGRFDLAGEGLEYDLIAEVPETHHTFEIPDGVKEITVEQLGNRIIVEMVPEKEPKPGDVCINENGSVYIFESIFSSTAHKCAYWVDNNGRRIVGGRAVAGRPATPEEAQPLFDALKKEGKRWNPKTMQVEDVPEKVMFKEGDVVFEDGRIMIVKMYPSLYHAMINTNNGGLHINSSYGIPFTSAHFRIATPDEAQTLFDALKKAGKRWNAETMQVEDMEEIYRILEWVEANIKDGYYNQVGIAEVIESYLKYREGKKK